LDAGVEEAAVGLAYAYLVGEGVDEIPARAFALYERAAKAGVKGSYVGLGHLYEYGIGTGRDRAAAIQWYEKAAKHGSLDAQRRLVGVYLRSTDAPARDRALYWSKRAADSGSPQAQNDYAWLLATSKHDDLRNGTLALDQAAKAVEVEPSAAFLDTLAAAYAELGEFEQAVAVQERALQAIAVSEGDIREELELRLAYYRRSEPWRE
jgi:tetratricopeptide (TPR) repeat protein